jgi:hypothetical protein
MRERQARIPDPQVDWGDLASCWLWIEGWGRIACGRTRWAERGPGVVAHVSLDFFLAKFTVGPELGRQCHLGPQTSKVTSVGL